LINALYAKFHRALVSLQNDAIGVTFPAAERTPGEKLRIHGNKENLEELMKNNWIKGLGDYTSVSNPKPVPSDVKQVSVRRVQTKMTAARIRRALARNSITEEDAERLLQKRTPPKLPYLQLRSQSTGQYFPLYFEQKKAGNEIKEGNFNTYGFSQTATLPWF
jgi:CRISPR-associated endonuclease Csy4